MWPLTVACSLQDARWEPNSGLFLCFADHVEGMFASKELSGEFKRQSKEAKQLLLSRGMLRSCCWGLWAQLGGSGGDKAASSVFRTQHGVSDLAILRQAHWTAGLNADARDG